MEDADLAWVLLLRMYKVLSLLKQMLYSRALFVNISIMYHSKRTESPLWKMFESNPSCLNEEPGETSFSVLSRCTVGDTTKHNFEHLSDMYSLLHVYRQIVGDTNFDINAPLCRSGHFKIKEDCEEVKAVASYFSEKIRELRSNVFRVYSGTDQSFKSKHGAQQTMIAELNPTLLYTDDLDDIVDSHAEYASKKIADWWLNGYVNVWPDAKESIHEENDDISLNNLSKIITENEVERDSGNEEEVVDDRGDIDDESDQIENDGDDGL